MGNSHRLRSEGACHNAFGAAVVSGFHCCLWLCMHRWLGKNNYFSTLTAQLVACHGACPVQETWNKRRVSRVIKWESKTGKPTRQLRRSAPAHQETDYGNENAPL